MWRSDKCYTFKHPVEIYVEVSFHGLGAALVQDSKQVAFALKALAATEQWYAHDGSISIFDFS